MHRYTSACTTGDVTFFRMSTSFSWMLGSCVRKWFLSPAKRTKESRRKLRERSVISYSRLVKILADGAVATLTSNSGNAVLSVSNNARTIVFHFKALSELALKTRPSLMRSETGVRQDLSAAGIRTSSLMIPTTESSVSMGLDKIIVRLISRACKLELTLIYPSLLGSLCSRRCLCRRSQSYRCLLRISEDLVLQLTQ